MSPNTERLIGKLYLSGHRLSVLFGGPAEPPVETERLPTRLRVLITVKAAPQPSTAYGETVCVAGLRLDPGSEGWVRLYPINFRHIESDQTFRKYDVVTVGAAPAREGRWESWRPSIADLKVEGHLDGWSDRMRYLEPHAEGTMCDLNARHKAGPSLGLIRAREVLDLVIHEHGGWSEQEQAKIDSYMAQGELFDSGKPKTALAPPPYKRRTDGCVQPLHATATHRVSWTGSLLPYNGT